MKKRIYLALVLLLVVLIVSLTGYSAAKYTDIFPGTGTVKFSAKLAERVTVTLNQGAADENGIATDLLIPGYDRPAKPYVNITGKTEIPAYLFLEVTDNTPNTAVIFAVDDGLWIPSALRGQTGSGHYVYSTDGVTPTKITTNLNVPILKAIEADMEIEVKQGLLAGGRNTNSITFNAYLEEAAKYDNSGT